MSTPVSKSDYGSGWPLTVTDGTLRCESGAVMIATHLAA